MCGIAGYLNFNTHLKAEIHVVKKMTDVMRHRGPDGEGSYVKNNLALGHRRLSIIDLTTGDQPMFNNEKSIVIVFNGEIYNYLELRNELIKHGYKFHTNSDTEVIIHAYEHWGFECQNRFNGMWAFALWDDRKKHLFISRDRIGEKPLFYYMNTLTIAFASEIKGILAFDQVKKEINWEVLELYLTLGYVPAPHTFYKNIFKLLPGHYIVIKDRSIKQIQYWDLPEINEDSMRINKSEIYEEFVNLLNHSVKIRMRSDVPFGAFLSGGLDSSSVVSIMSQISQFAIQTFTVGFQDKIFDERSLAKLVAEKYNCLHRDSLFEPDSIEKSIGEALYFFDEPFGDSSSVPTFQVSKLASQNVKMVLTGDGGDETLSGYSIYQGEKFASFYKRAPKSLKYLTYNVLLNAKYLASKNINYDINRILNIFDSSNLNFYERVNSKISWIEPNLVKSLLQNHKGLIPIEDYLNDFRIKCKYKDNFYKLSYYNFKLSLPDDILTKVDRMSMANSLETRIPFLDYRVIEMMIHVHKNVKMQGFENKSILRRTIGKDLPNKLLQTKKKGFVAPSRNWFNNTQQLNNLYDLNNKTLKLYPSTLKKIFDDNLLQKKDCGNFIWMVALLLNWFENK